MRRCFLSKDERADNRMEIDLPDELAQEYIFAKKRFDAARGKLNMLVDEVLEDKGWASWGEKD
jgi:hypothetical protein